MNSMLNESDLLVVDDSSVTEDITTTAENVLISGSITSNMQNEEASLVDASIILYPESFRDSEPITVSGIYSDGSLDWSTNVEPGVWIVVVESSVFDENTGGVSIGFLDANIVDGGTLNMTMSSGGYVELSTTWDDIQLQSHHVGSNSTGIEMIQNPVEVSIDIGLGAIWNYSLDNDGMLSLLLPVGDFQVTSTFTSIQHERNLEMDYFGISGTVRASFSFYNTKEEIDYFCKSLERAVAMLS